MELKSGLKDALHREPHPKRRKFQHLDLFLKDQPDDVLLETNIERSPLLKVLPNLVAVVRADAADPQVRRRRKPRRGSVVVFIQWRVGLSNKDHLPVNVVNEAARLDTPQHLAVSAIYLHYDRAHLVRDVDLS